MRWNYSTSESLGNAKTINWFRSNGLKVMGATAGQTRWVLMPQKESNMENIKTFAVNSIDNGLNGLLLTLWDDDSPHFELYMRGIIAFAEYAWTSEKRSKQDLKSGYRHREFSNTVADEKFAFIDDLEKPVAFWKNALLKGNKRNSLQKMDNALENAVITLPSKQIKGEWSKKYAKRLEQAAVYSKSCDTIATKIAVLKSQAIRNNYTLEVYEQVNKLVQFTNNILLALQVYDSVIDTPKEAGALSQIKQLPEEFKTLRKEFEAVYGKTRLLKKPANYILDQDHHSHLGNQTISFDWQFYAEMLFMEKIDKEM
jgi:hypothetical protein